MQKWKTNAHCCTRWQTNKKLAPNFACIKLPNEQQQMKRNATHNLVETRNKVKSKRKKKQKRKWWNDVKWREKEKETLQYEDITIHERNFLWIFWWQAEKTTYPYIHTYTGTPIYLLHWFLQLLLALLFFACQKLLAHLFLRSSWSSKTLWIDALAKSAFFSLPFFFLFFSLNKICFCFYEPD